MVTLLHTFSLAAIYGLFACGLTLIFGVLEVLNLAHAVIFAFATLFAMYLVDQHHLSLWMACAVSIIAAGLIAAIVDQIAFRPLRNRSGSTVWGRHVGPLLTSIGAATTLIGLERAWFGIDPRHFPNDLVRFPTISIGSTTINVVGLITFAVFILITLGLTFALNNTRWGVEVRAVAERSETAVLFGINAERRYIETMFLAGILAGIAGVAWGLTFNIASPETGSQIDVKGFALIILGGMGSIPGSLIGAIIIAAIEVICGLWFPNGLQTLVLFAGLIVILLVRPQGILGRPLVEGAR
jgi:branched-chain amino acid transport system permease protein